MNRILQEWKIDYPRDWTAAESRDVLCRIIGLMLGHESLISCLWVNGHVRVTLGGKGPYDPITYGYEDLERIAVIFMEAAQLARQDQLASSAAL